MNDSGSPVFEPEFAEVLRRYALLGIEHWGTLVDSGVKRHAGTLLAGRIAETDVEVDDLLAQRFTGKYEPAYRFVPLPLVPTNRSPKAALFLPVSQIRGSKEATWFDVLVVLDSKHAFGLRYETGDDDGFHCYGHVQFSREFLNRELKTERELFRLPISYPAIPVGGQDPLSLFLSMAVSFHGYSGDPTHAAACIPGLLRQILDPDAQRARELIKQITILIKP